MYSHTFTSQDEIAIAPARTGLTLCLCGDVMTGRGIDQALHASVAPRIYEPYVQDARDYVRLAELKNGPIRRPMSYTALWGDALKVWEALKPEVKIINLETSITTHPEPWPGKGIQYRMHPANVALLTAAGIGIAILANNHTLDWGRQGLLDTLQALQLAGISTAGAGENLKAAQRPLIWPLQQGRLVLFAFGVASSGVPPAWAATADLPGINFLPDLGRQALQHIAAQVKAIKQKGDVVVLSVHWGDNWGYEVPEVHRTFAHALVEQVGVDLIFGHSSHHPLGLEVYQGKLIVYGAGDLINDYEGIGGHEQYRADLALLYFPEIAQATGALLSLWMAPLQIRNFGLHQARVEDANWLTAVLHRESMKYGTAVVRHGRFLALDVEGLNQEAYD